MIGIRNSKPKIDSVFPPAALPGGCLEIRGSRLGVQAEAQPEVYFDNACGRLVAHTAERLLVNVPEEANSGEFSIVVGKARSAPCQFHLGHLRALDMHPVANPALDAAGNIYTTESGARGKQTSVSVYKIGPDDGLAPFVKGIVNPTGLLFRPDGTLLVSSRHEGTVYAVSPEGQLETFAEGMGVATGLALDAEENVYVGDRSGTVFKISKNRKIYVFATLEPSVAAYHLAIGPDGNLFVSAPTTSSFDAIHRIDGDGNVQAWKRGFGRPQGLAFDAKGRLHLCASYRGKRGVFRVPETGSPEQVVSGQGIVGLAFAGNGDIVVVTGTAVYQIDNPG